MQSFISNSYRAAATALGLGLLMAGTPTFAAAQNTPARTTDPYLVLEHRSPDQISADDAAVLRAKQSEITREAAMFGYDLTAGHWTWDQAVCPDIPEAILLHERSVSRSGAQSLFTAVVPRGAGRVRVVPILYRGATPFAPAVGSERLLSVFNQAVPADLAKQAVAPGGNWLTLAMCFAEVAGTEPRVPQNPDVEPSLLSAPPPTLRVSSLRGAMELQFTGREAPRQYTVWNITVNNVGRALAAQARVYPERIYAENASAAEPPSLPITSQPVEPAPAAQPETTEPADAPAPPASQPVSVQPAQPVVEQPGAPEPSASAVPAQPAAVAPAVPAAAQSAAPTAETAPQEPAMKVKRVKEKKVRQKKSDHQIEPTVRELTNQTDPTEKPLPY